MLSIFVILSSLTSSRLQVYFSSCPSWPLCFSRVYHRPRCGYRHHLSMYIGTPIYPSQSTRIHPTSSRLKFTKN
ncbi:hypothetical protein GALMADRAFT_898516 [Galerina marginata CBS 339.88]|uniref:Secreted protein n=1 Tax=Galerina marginata (strain CBS 339.88) TaxID=685588 RepID=A0A067ST96_GALM3|nr:hypothetical protein GALMADRAFT_898516 [Galerina marginata CBS 339.88]